MALAKLTVKKVQAIKEPGRYGDGDGLFLQVARGGSKSWILRTMVQGRRRDIGLGGSSWVSLAEAREAARAMRRTAREGGDPVAVRNSTEAILTFREAALRVHELSSGAWRSDGKHVGQWLASLELDVFPAIGDKPVNTITSGDVLAVLTPIWHQKPETARRLRQRMRRVFAWAKGANMYLEENPVDRASGSLPRQAATKRHHPAMPYQELPEFFRALGERSGVAALALRFLILTASRSGEVRGARWSEINLPERTWAIPSDRMKTSKPHRVPLTDTAIEILDQVRGLDQALVFPGQRRGRPMSDMTIAAVMKRMGASEFVPHGFRSTFRDWASERTNIPREIAELALAHEVGNAVERAYARSDLFEKRRDLMERWGQHCTGDSAEVVSLHG